MCLPLRNHAFSHFPPPLLGPKSPTCCECAGAGIVTPGARFTPPGRTGLHLTLIYDGKEVGFEAVVFLKHAEWGGGI